MRSIGDRSDPAASERLSTLRAAIGQISPTDDIDLFGLLTTGLMQELVMGPTSDPVDNLEQALDLGQNLLATLRALSADPSDTASVCGDVADLYLRRAHGPRSGNIERAIELTVERIALLRSGTPDWAKAQAQLAFALTERAGRERAAAAEQAIACCEAALEVLDPDTDPGAWADAHNALGSAYQVRTVGSRSENIERARHALEEALDVLGDTPPEETNTRRTWANLHFNLGTVYEDRLLGGNDDNMRRAIYHYERELSVSSQDRDPISWAMTQVSLASAYSQLGGDDPAETQRRAIEAFKTALSIFTRDRTPEQWAHAQDLLGLLLCDAEQVGRRPVDLDAAAECFAAALQVYGRESHPFQWADVQMNRAWVDPLRAARSTAGSPARQTHLAEAVAHCEEALQVFASDTLPLQFANAQANLGDALAGWPRQKTNSKTPPARWKPRWRSIRCTGCPATSGWYAPPSRRSTAGSPRTLGGKRDIRDCRGGGVLRLCATQGSPRLMLCTRVLCSAGQRTRSYAWPAVWSAPASRRWYDSVGRRTRWCFSNGAARGG